MVRGLILAGVITFAAGPAWAASCVEPYAPAIPNGATATKDQMLTAQGEVKSYLKAADQYQDCMLTDLRMQRDAAARDQKTLDQRIVDRSVADIDTNQREKVRVGAEYNTAVQVYAAAHPEPAPAAH